MMEDTLESLPLKSNKPSIVMTITGCLVVFAAFALRLSTSVGSILIPLSCCLILVTSYRKVWKNIRNNHVCLLATLLVVFAAIRMLNHSATWHLRIDSFKHYLPLFFIPILMVLFQHSKTWANKTILAFALGILFYIVLCVINHFNILPLAQWLHRQPQDMYLYGRASFILALTTFILAEFSLKKNISYNLKIFYGISALFMAWSILFVSTVRSDYVLLLVAAIVFVIIHANKKWLLASMAALFLLAFLAYKTSPQMHTGINRIDNAIHLYEQGNPKTSSGLRLLFIHNSLHLWKKNPIFGTGTGSFQKEYLTLHSLTTDAAPATINHVLDQPHNQYVYTAVEMGLIGLFLLVGFFIAILKNSFNLPPAYRNIALATVIVFSVHSLFCSTIFYHAGKYTLVLLVALCFSHQKIKE